MRVLIDTCVIIDALQSRVPFAEAAQKIFLHSANKQFEGYITAKASTDIYYLTHHLIHSDVETRNVRDYVKSPIKVYEPSAFLKVLDAEKESE